MQFKKLGSVAGEGFESIIWYVDESLCWFIGDSDIDSDGGQNVDNDPDWQADTSLHFQGKPIDAQAVPGIVVPSWIPVKVKGIVLGCQAEVINLNTMLGCPAVVHDLGPKTKTGEITPYLAKQLGINPNSVNGGEDNPIFLFRFWPGKAALVHSVQFDLQHI